MRHAAALAAVLLAACGGPALFAELEIPAVGITLPPQEFPGSTADPSRWCAPDRPDCIRTELVYDVGNEVELLSDENAEYEIRLTDLALALDATVTTTDLGGIRSAIFEVVPPDGSTPVVVASYVRSESDPNPTSIAVSGSSSLDLAPFLDQGQVRILVKLSLDEATPPFTAQVGAVFYLRVKLDYGRAAGL